jgi:hypothetical protein
VNHLGIKFETRRIGAYEIGFNYGDGPGTKHDILGALGATSVARAWERSGSGSGKRERGSAFFKKWSGAKRLRSVYIYIYKKIYILKKKTCRMPNMMQNL